MAKKVKLRKGALERLFWVISITFILGCFLFYGLRLVKYYKIYNPKVAEEEMLLADSIIKESPIVYEEDGLYIASGSYIYKGKEVNNYIRYSGLLWRIVTIKNTKEINIVLDDSINSLRWNKNITNFNESDISKYLNNVFAKGLDLNLLSKAKTCLDSINELTDVKCTNVNIDDYVRLLNINEFLNTKTEDSYLGNNDLWLENRSDTQVWHTNGGNLSLADSTETYLVRPVVTLNRSNKLIKGTGTKDDPYIISEDKNELTVGSYVKLGDDKWVIYGIENNTVRLSLANLYENITYRFSLTSNKYESSQANSLAKYLNNDFYNSLSYKDKLIKTNWYVGEYKDSYEAVYDQKVNEYVGLLNVADLKFDSSLGGYYLLTPVDSKAYIYDNDLIPSTITLSRAIRPTIMITKKDIKSGNGTISSPFELEV